MGKSRGHYIVAGEIWPPWLERTNHSDPMGFSGITWEILQRTSDILDFTFTFVQPEDGKWGSIDQSGEWNGMIGMIQRKEIDFAIGPFGMNPERARACEFSVPIALDHLIPVTPVLLNKDPWVLARPFDFLVWTSLLGLCAVCIGTLVLMTLLLPQGHSVGVVVEFVVKSLVNEGSVTIRRTSKSLSIMSTFWLFGMMVLVHSYSGTLTALLAVPKAPFLVESMEDLTNQDMFPWKIETGSVLEQMSLTADPATIFGGFVRGAQPGAGTCYDNIENIENGEYAMVCERISVEKMISDGFSKSGKCSLYSGRIAFMSLAFAMAFQVR
ncbi:hypothetical protein TCAL_13350 [Tigriopus californicus]|uniref:Ionotropic glutamate receptor L-glutamate and glycine-binding domain-containing protein n=1 Tax=Tigriopus californicus TaxID=6832 RepID=A0A553PS13_TIGCA|nr:hypothetical protein TCAL_13350 [Tigriopus californicus]|eukprot:TCALIF_13350-PA protein Name:"Similar to grid2 Glutamate receptor ionotropic, delta-2 (Danio rerio)" AED:0.01 eAED:0.01 QI:0/-1/0/1/-1/1/1/0/325